MAFNGGNFIGYMPEKTDLFAPLPEATLRKFMRKDENAKRAADSLAWNQEMARAQIARDRRMKGSSLDYNDPNTVTNFMGFDPRTMDIPTMKTKAPMGVLGQGLPDGLLKQFSNDDIMAMGKASGNLESMLGRLDVDRLRTFPAHVVASLLDRAQRHLVDHSEVNYNPAYWGGAQYTPGPNPADFRF